MKNDIVGKKILNLITWWPLIGYLVIFIIKAPGALDDLVGFFKMMAPPFAILVLTFTLKHRLNKRNSE